MNPYTQDPILVKPQSDLPTSSPPTPGLSGEPALVEAYQNQPDAIPQQALSTFPEQSYQQTGPSIQTNQAMPSAQPSYSSSPSPFPVNPSNPYVSASVNQMNSQVGQNNYSSQMQANSESMNSSILPNSANTAQNSHSGQPPSTGGQMPPAFDMTPKKKSSKKKLLIIFGILFLLLLGAGLFFVLKDTNSENSNEATLPVSEPVKKISPKPLGVLYSKSTDLPDTQNDCSNTSNSINFKPLADGDDSKVLDLGDNNYVQQNGIFENKVFMVVGPGCGSKSKTTLYYSQDSGETYSKLYEGSGPDDNGSADQITSATFSSDGKSIIYAVLPPTGSKNSVKTIDLTTKETQNLFTSEYRGVFINSYDTKNQKVYFTKGCYNCDGNSGSKILVYDIETKSESTILDLGKSFNVGFAFNEDFSQAFVATGEASTEGPGAGPPYKVYNFTLEDKKLSEVTGVNNDDYILKVGYRDDGMAYFANSKAVYGVSSGKIITLFEPDESLRNVFLVKKDNVVVQTNKGETSTILNFVSSSKKADTVMTFSEKETISVVGVIWSVEN